MDPAAEQLIRSALHDTANLLSGIRGIIDLSEPDRPLSPRDRNRLDAVLREGIVMVQRTRHIALDTLPDPTGESPEAWTGALRDQLEPLSTMFRAPIHVACEAPPARAVPGPVLREFVHGMARLLLPYAGERGLQVRCRCHEDRWRVDFEPAEAIPDCLLSSATGRKDIAARWVGHLSARLGIALEHHANTLTATLGA